jgi:gas vesicle protein
MKNNKTLITAILLGAAAAGAAAYMLLTEDGAELRSALSDQFTKLKDSVLGGGEEEQEETSQPEYLQHKQKAPKTDRDALLHGEILHDQPHK